MNILRSLKRLLTKPTLIILERYYESIDEMFLNAWIKCNNDDLRYTRRTLDNGTEQEDIKQWEVLQNQYLLCNKW